MTDDQCDGPKQIKISWSALLSHEVCKQRSHLYREKKKAIASNIRPFFHGTVSDRIMRRWLDSDDPREGEMVEWVSEMVEHCLSEAERTGDGVVQWKSPTDRRDMEAWIRRLLRKLEPMLVEKVLPFEYEAEHRFRVPIRIPDLAGNTSEILLTGGMDILVREQVDPMVWVGYDLKATENPDYIRKTLGQAMFYDLAVFAASGTPLRTFEFLLPMVREQPIVPVAITTDDRMSLLSRIVKMAHDIWKNDIAPRPDSSQCGWCPVKHACAKFKPGKQVWAPKLGKAAAARQAEAS